jgi:flavin reductase (DIM6/NTAB) family NADH-FMN oxidoreductase RutF
MSSEDLGSEPDGRGNSAMVPAERFRRVLGHFASGLVIITARTPDRTVGMSCQSFFSLSLDPPLVALSPSRTSTTWPHVRRAGKFCVSILGEDQAELCRRFSMSGTDKFAGVGWATSAIVGAPVIDGCLAWIECAIEDVHDAGDHYLAVARVLDLDARDGTPLLFYRGRFGSFRT